MMYSYTSLYIHIYTTGTPVTDWGGVRIVKIDQSKMRLVKIDWEGVETIITEESELNLTDAHRGGGGH